MTRDEEILDLLERRPEWWGAKVAPRLAPEGDCLVWTGPRTNGYGAVHLPGVLTSGGHHAMGYVHRIAYLRHSETPISSEVLDHLCRVPTCAHVPHLDAVSQRTNLLRGDTFVADELRRTVCPKGHPISGPDALLIPSLLAKGMRACLICHRERATYYNALRKKEKTV